MNFTTDEKQVFAKMGKRGGSARWKGTTKAQRRAHALKMLAARKDRQPKPEAAR